VAIDCIFKDLLVQEQLC